MPQRSIQVLVALLLVACGLLVAAALDHAEQEQASFHTQLAPLQNPTMTITSGRGRLLLAGTTASPDHEAALLQLAREQFPDTATQSNFQPGVITPDAWISTSYHLLRLLAATESAHATMGPGSIEIRAVSGDAATLTTRMNLLRENASAETLIDSDVLVVDTTTSFEQLCLQTFVQLGLKPVSFKQSSAEIRTSSFATLDRITDFASDCKHTKIAITGHADASGNESWNRQLSLARAQAVADWLVRGGIDPQRLLVQGAGSSVPIADNTTAQGRSLNRRIEFDLR